MTRIVPTGIGAAPALPDIMSLPEAGRFRGMSSRSFEMRLETRIAWGMLFAIFADQAQTLRAQSWSISRSPSALAASKSPIGPELSLTSSWNELCQISPIAGGFADFGGLKLASPWS